MKSITLLSLVAALLVAVAAAGPAGAIVPPKNCHTIKVGSKSYQVKADIRCKRARKYARRYLAGNGAPDGWSCQRYSRSETNIAFKGTRGQRSVFAIRR